MRRTALLLLPIVFACTKGSDPFGSLTVDEVEARLADPNVRVFDANGESSYKEGHVKGAAHVTFNALTQADLPSNKDATLIFYCKNEH